MEMITRNPRVADNTIRLKSADPQSLYSSFAVIVHENSSLSALLLLLTNSYM